MTYGVFNLESGNLIDSLESEQEALALISSLLDDDGVGTEMLGLNVLNDRGHTVASLHGRALQDAVDAGAIQTTGAHA